MSYIYVITNNINGKQYVGKTDFTIEQRWKSHVSDCYKKKDWNRPLYRAIRKHGVENFNIKVLEECENTNANNRECFWIKKLNTYEDGYNATLGGDGQSLYNHEEILQSYYNGLTLKQIQLNIGCDEKTIRRVLRASGILNARDNYLQQHNCQVQMLDKNTKNILLEFTQYKKAAEWICKNNYTNNSNLQTVANNIRKAAIKEKPSAYGFCWNKI